MIIITPPSEMASYPFAMRLFAFSDVILRRRDACRRYAGIHAGLILCAPVFWAAFTFFLSPVSGALGFVLHAWFCLPKKRSARILLLLSYPVLALGCGWKERDLSSGFLFPAPARIPEALHFYAGTVENFPKCGEYGCDFPFRTARGLFLASLPADVPPPPWGITGLLLARAQPPDAPDNPGQTDPRRKLRSQGELAFLSGETWIDLHPPPNWKRALAAARRYCERCLKRYVPNAGRPLLAGALLNETQDIPEETHQAFLRSGMQHLLAISGEHLALLMAFLLAAGLGLRLPRKAAFIFAAAVIAAYIPLVGSPASVVRAGLMLACFLPAVLRDRPASGLNALCLSLAVELLFHPYLILGLGFQLSYAATLAIILCAGPGQAFAASLNLPRRLQGAAQMIFLSGMVNLFTYPILAISTHAFAPWSVLGNLVTVPVTGAMLIAGLCTCAFGFFPWLASRTGACAGMASLLLDGSVHGLARLPGALLSIAQPSAIWLWIFVFAVIIITVVFRARAWRIGCLGLAVLIAAEAFRPAWTRLWEGNAARITFLSVGQGDGAVVELPGAVYVIDAGPSVRIAQRVVLPYLRSRGIQHLEALVLTHPDCDHFGGGFALVGSIPIKNIVGPPTDTDVQTSWKNLEALARRKGVPWRQCRAGEWLYRRGAVSLSIIGPDSTLDSASDNNRSVVCLLSTPQARALFTGDIEGPGQTALASTWPLWRHAWLKAPHHGSDRTTLPCFLQAEDPPHAVISSGHRPGFPGPQTVASLRALGAEVRITARDGAVGWNFGKKQTRDRKAP